MRSRLAAVVRKEFREYRRNRLIIITMALVPVIFLAIPIGTLAALPDEVPREAVEAIVGQAMLFFLIIPVMLPTTIAAYTVIGEKEQSTLEPVLTTPATDEEILTGKALAATVPSVLIAWLLFAVFLIFAALAGSELVGELVFRPGWIVAQLALAPAVAVLAIEVGMAVSLRSSDIRVAQQVAGLAMLPVLGGLVLFTLGVLEPTATTMLACAVVIGAVDVAGWRLLVRLFDRERLLTKFG